MTKVMNPYFHSLILYFGWFAPLSKQRPFTFLQSDILYLIPLFLNVFSVPALVS